MSGQQNGSAGASIVVPGNHDGVHLGHQALLRGARALAQPQGLLVKALTFSPHPAALLSPERAPSPLTTIERRVELLEAAGADEVAVQPFDHAFASLSPSEFLDWLVGLGTRGVVVGPDFRFGKDRAGDTARLRRFAREQGMLFKIEPPVLLDGERVSSSAVRAAVAGGLVGHAAELLGHVYDIAGVVEKGDGRGASLGFPTANLRCEPVLRPADGVYTVVARLLDPDGEGIERAMPPLCGVANIGVRPTFEAGRSVEIHLFDFAQDIYGRRLRVGFIDRVRGELRFAGVDALKAQIEVDCQVARQQVAAADRGTWAWI